VGIAYRFLAARFGQAGPWTTTARGLKQEKVVGVAQPAWLGCELELAEIPALR